MAPGARRYLPGFNQHGIVDAADCTVWRDNLGTATTLPNETVSLGTVDSEDHDAWKASFGATAGAGSGAAAGSAGASPSHTAVPEPASLLVLMIGLATAAALPLRK